MKTATLSPEDLSTELVKQGAILTLWNHTPEAFLVGRLQWLSEERVFFFAANGDSPADAHLIDFDATDAEHDAVRFFQDGKLVGVLTSLDQAEVADREDYRVGWQIWQITAPMKETLIDRLVAASQPE